MYEGVKASIGGKKVIRTDTSLRAKLYSKRQLLVMLAANVQRSTLPKARLDEAGQRDQQQKALKMTSKIHALCAWATKMTQVRETACLDSAPRAAKRSAVHASLSFTLSETKIRPQHARSAGQQLVSLTKCKSSKREHCVMIDPQGDTLVSHCNC